jgi:serine protease Do
VSRIPKKLKLNLQTILGLLLLTAMLFMVPGADASNLRRSPVVIAVEAARPSVVNISTEMVVRRSSPFGDVGDPRLDRFFRDFYEGGSTRRQYTRTSLGSGVVIRPDGYILTNEHVILRASKVTVTLLDGREFPAQVVGSDPSSDLAILKIEAKNLPTIKVGRSDDLMIGETLIAIGNPFGLSNTVTTGVVSATHRSFRAKENRVFTDFIQTDASINPGNSGGPVLNIDGELVGINTAIFGEAEGIGFAIPIDRAQRIVQNLIRFGKVLHGWIGLRVDNLSAATSATANVKVGKGVIVTHVFNDSPAAKAGFRKGDVIYEVGDIPTGLIDNYRSAVLSVTVGSTVALAAIRNGQAIRKNVTATELPVLAAEQFAWRLLGISVVPNSQKVAKSYRLSTKQGMVISKVRVDSPAGKVGVKPGDVLLAIGGRTINSRDDFRVACASLRLSEAAIVVVQRHKRAYYLSMRLQ